MMLDSFHKSGKYPIRTFGTMACLGFWKLSIGNNWYPLSLLDLLNNYFQSHFIRYLILSSAAFANDKKDLNKVLFVIGVSAIMPTRLILFFSNIIRQTYRIRVSLYV